MAQLHFDYDMCCCVGTGGSERLALKVRGCTGDEASLQTFLLRI